MLKWEKSIIIERYHKFFLFEKIFTVKFYKAQYCKNTAVIYK
jgi:hypothetical protein